MTADEMNRPMARDRMIGASCSLDEAELRERLAEWRRLRAGATAIEEREGGIRLELSHDHPIDPIARLVELESACCAFYRFRIEAEGATRALTIDAGPDGAPAVRGLLGLDP